MRKADFDHVIASAALISGEEEIVVIGSQSIWGSVEDPPEAMLRSLEADIYPREDPSLAEEIDGQIIVEIPGDRVKRATSGRSV